MSLSDESKNVIRVAGLRSPRDQDETVPMHPEDFKAHLSWIMARRFHEMVLNEELSEKVEYNRSDG